MIDARLVRLTEGETGEDDQVEVAHEALVRNWPRLVDWLDMERESMRRRLRLTTAAEEWETQDRDPSDLLRGRLLEEAESYPDLNELEREFVAESRAAVKKEERDKEAVRQRELEQARALATSEQRRAEQQARDARRLRWLTYALAGMFVVAVVAATLAAVAWQEAENQADSAEAAQARAEAAEKEATSRLLAIVQWREYFQEGKLDMALHTLQQAEELDPDLQSERGPKLAWAYHEVCVKGRSGGQSETVQPACQRAEQLASEIPFEETVGGIVQARHGDLWMFQGTPGQVVSVRMEQEDSELDTYLTLYSPDGTLLGENDDFGDGTDSRIDWVVLSSPVTYTIVAFGAEDTFGAYVLTLTHEQMPASEAVQMLIGQSIKYARRGLIDQALAALNLAVELDPDLQSERGPKLAWAYHEVCVKGGSGGQTKAVRPACQRARELATEIPFEETVGGVVKARQGDLWTFQGTAGQAVTLRMEQDNSELDTYLTLYSPDGTLLGENDDPGGSYDSLIAQVVLWDTGPHTIVVRGLGNSSGAYTLKLTFEQVSPSKAAQKLVQQGAEYASQDLIDQALTALYLAENLDPLLDPTQASDLVVAYNMVCWMGSLGGRAEAVLPFCQRAVDLEPGHGGIRDSRGLARALTGDLEGAVEDFEFYVEWVQDRRPIDMIEKRRTWIEALEVGRNPFDKETLEALRHE
jgi:tetratricopeptide (TPR) repeat protein